MLTWNPHRMLFPDRIPDPDNWSGSDPKSRNKLSSVTKIELINSSNGTLNPTLLVCYYRVIIRNNFIYTLLLSFLTKMYFIITRTRCNIFKLLAMSTVVYFILILVCTWIRIYEANKWKWMRILSQYTSSGEKIRLRLLWFQTCFRAMMNKWPYRYC
jgi:hypothetical protein